MSALQGTLFVLWAVVGTLVVVVREPVRQAVLVGVMGLVSALAFFSVQAPDVALSMLVVGGLGLPALLLLAMARIRQQELDGDGEEDGE